MQDSSNRGWDAQFVDTAWGEMRQMLDRELPVSAGRGKRRRALLFAAVFFLGLTLGGLGIYLADSPGIGYFPVPDRALALQLDASEPVSGAETPANHTKTNTINKALQKNTQSNILPVETSLASNPIETAVENRPEEPVTPLLTENDEAKNTPFVVDAGEASSFLEQTTPTEEQHPVAGTPVEDRALPPLEELMLLPAGELERLLRMEEQHTDGFPVPPVIAATEPARVNWGAELGANYYQTPGYFGGLAVDYHLNNRWGLQSGLRYGQLSSGLNQPRGGAREEAFSQADQTPQRDPSTGLNTNLDNQGERVSAPVNYYDVDISLQHIGVPLLVNYRLNRKWKVGAGLQAHYLVAARRPVQNSTQDKAYAAQASVSSSVRELTGLTASDDRIDGQFLQRWNLGASLGAGFQPADRWSFQLQYHYGLLNWLETDRYFLSPTSVQLSAVYRLNR
jgi:hypothetical protein